MKIFGRMLVLATLGCCQLGATAVQVEYLYQDGQSNTVLVGNSSMGYRHFYRYSAYGMQSDVYHPLNGGQQQDYQVFRIDDNPFGYGGQRRDPSTALWSLGNGYRQYDPVISGFMQADSLSAFSGKNTENAFAYAGGNPIGYNDPTGHFKVSTTMNSILNGVGVSLSLASLLVTRSSITLLGVLAGGVGYMLPAALSKSTGKLDNSKKINHFSFGLGVSSSIFGITVLSVVYSQFCNPCIDEEVIAGYSGQQSEFGDNTVDSFEEEGFTNNAKNRVDMGSVDEE
ncbi:MAG: RHS repeat-associated core domain-containing protein [Francisellaceae bacterium]